MPVAVYDVPDGNARETLFQLRFEPRGHIRAERVYEEDAVRSNQKQAIPRPVSNAIDIISYFDDLARGSALHCGHARRGAFDGSKVYGGKCAGKK
jgi:hypothetical protein